jgi:mRNA interferase RelE/StbE
MDSYRIEWKRSAIKDLRKLPKDMLSKITAKVGDLQNDPYPDGVRKLTGSKYTYRIRLGKYRVVYNVLGDILIIEIIRIAHRKDVYRN